MNTIKMRRTLLALVVATVAVPTLLDAQTSVEECASAGGSYTETCSSVSVKFLGITIGSKVECKSSCNAGPSDEAPAAS